MVEKIKQRVWVRRMRVRMKEKQNMIDETEASKMQKTIDTLNEVGSDLRMKMR